MLDVRRSPELQAAILAMKSADRDLRRDIYAEARARLGGEWVPALRQRATTRMQEAILIKGARTRVGTDGFRMVAASSRRKLRGGLIPSEQWAGAEFGARARRVTVQTHSRKGKAYTVTKTINRQFPSRVKDGRVVFDAASALGTRLVALWVRAIVDRYRAAAERK